MGKVDLVKKITSRPAGPFEEPGFEALSTSGDPRARPYVVDKLTAALAKVGTHKLTGWRSGAWDKFRIAALHALVRVGTADDVALVEQLLAAAKKGEKGVVAAANATLEALRKPANP